MKRLFMLLLFPCIVFAQTTKPPIATGSQDNTARDSIVTHRKNIDSLFTKVGVDNATRDSITIHRTAIDAKLAASDTVSLSARINTKLAGSDTLSLSSRINAKIGAADTVSLSSRINGKVDTADIAKTKVADSLTSGTLPVARLAASGVGAGSYTYPYSVTVDQYGRVTAATTGAKPAFGDTLMTKWADSTGIASVDKGTMVWDSTLNKWQVQQAVKIGGTVGSVLALSASDSVGNSDWISFERDSSNMFFGVDSGYRTGGYGNVAIGKNASLRGDDSTFFNVAIGYETMENNLGYRNTAVGANSQEFNTTGYNNTSIGAFAMQWNTTGSRNTALGYAALYNNIDGWWNTAVGYAARWEAIGGNYNTAVGYYSQMTDTSGDKNSSLGYFSLYKNYADGNTAMGYAAMYGNTSGQYCTALGHAAGYENTEGNYNIFLGYNAGNGYQATANNQFIAGSYWGPIWNVYFGEGRYDSTPSAYTINGTSAMGTNVAGGDLQLAGGNSTGNAAGGRVVFKTVKAYQGSGVSENENSKVRGWFDTQGNFVVDTTTFFVDATKHQVIFGNNTTTSTEKVVVYNAVMHFAGASNERQGFMLDRGVSLKPSATQGAIFVQTNAMGSDDGMVFRADGYKIQSEDSVDRISIATNGAVTVGSTLTATQFRLSTLNSAPANAGDTGTTGEIRIVDGYIYVCVNTNTWKRAAIATWP